MSEVFFYSGIAIKLTLLIIYSAQNKLPEQPLFLRPRELMRTKNKTNHYNYPANFPQNCETHLLFEIASDSWNLCCGAVLPSKDHPTAFISSNRQTSGISTFPIIATNISQNHPGQHLQIKIHNTNQRPCSSPPSCFTGSLRLRKKVPTFRNF